MIDSLLTDDYELRDLVLKNDKLIASIYLPINLSYFDGHFDGFPILPGVVQLHWAIILACKKFKIDPEFSSIDVIKFIKIIKPDNLVTLEIDYNKAKQSIEFKYLSKNGKHSMGKVRFDNNA